jgi:ABC-type glutathione transport system ATPase component
MGQQIPVLVNRASLDRHTVPNGGNRLLQPRSAVHNEELGPVQAAVDEIVDAVRDLDLEVDKGQIFGLIGPTQR